MAITIQQDITGFRPAYNDDFYVVSSSNVAQTNFQFIADLYVNGSYVTRLKTFPHATHGTGLFNPKRAIENYVTKDFDLATNLFATNDNSFCYYQLRFGEQYGTSGTIYANLTNTSTKYVWNSIFDYEEYTDFDDTQYILSNSNCQFLTNAPDNLKIQSNERNYLYGITDTSGDIYYLNITTFDSSGAQIDSYKLYNQYQDVSTNARKFFRVGVGTYNFNDISSGDYAYSEFGNFPVIGSNVAKYNVQTSKQDGTVTSETRTYFVEDVCTKTEATRLFFLNKLGGYDAITFKNKTKINADITRSNFKKPQGEWVNSNSFVQGRANRAVTQYDTNIKDTFTIVSDWLTEAQSVWLEELFTSPDVYVDKNGIERVPINITASSYETKQTAVAKLINYTLEYTYSYSRYRQRF
jgi:hypothetical protein